MTKSLAIAAVIAIGTAGAVQAATTLDTGVLHFNVYQTSADANATASSIAAGSLLASFDYLGNVNFTDGGANNILAFLNSASGTLFNFTVGGTSSLNTLMSVSGYSLSTLMDITGSLNSGGTASIRHDDGISFCQGGPCNGVSSPTGAITETFPVSSGSFELIYSAANGLPEVLQANMAAVPLPATGLLLLGGIGGFGALRRRKVKTKTA